MTINVCVQYNGGFLPDIILLALCYYHRGTRLNAMKRCCLCSPCSHLNVLTISLPCLEGAQGLDAFRSFLKHISLFYSDIPLNNYILVRIFLPPQCFESVAFEDGSPEWCFDVQRTYSIGGFVRLRCTVVYSGIYLCT